MQNPFTEHPHSVGETYFQHLVFASIFGFRMLIGGFACLIHAVFPFWFKKTGSDYLLKMTHNFVQRMPHDEARIKQLRQSINKEILAKQNSA